MLIGEPSMDFSRIDKEPFLPGYGIVYQGTRVGPTINSIPGKTVIVNMDDEVVDAIWVVRTKTLLGEDTTKVHGVIHVGIKDLDDAVLPDEVFIGFLDAGIAFLKQGINLYVHCFAGASRSSYYTIGLYMRLGLTSDQAFSRVWKARRTACPNKGFVAHLKKLDGIIQRQRRIILP